MPSANEVAAKYIREVAEKCNRSVEVLEAGCGRRWSLSTQDISMRLTGVDLDSLALKHRIDVIKDLDVAIESDLLEVELDDASFDVIYSAFVLEHVEAADVAMLKFAQWLAPEGVLLLKIPDPVSVHGFVTKNTPHWIHVLYKKYIEGRPNAGKPGHEPYPTYYADVLFPKGMEEFVATHDLELLERFNFHPYLRIEKPLVWLLHILSFGKLNRNFRNVMYVLRKKSLEGRIEVDLPSPKRAMAHRLQQYPAAS